MLGSSPQEAAGETWGIGKVGAQSQSSWAIVRYTPESGWSLAPAILDGSGASAERLRSPPKACLRARSPRTAAARCSAACPRRCEPRRAAAGARPRSGIQGDLERSAAGSGRTPVSTRSAPPMLAALEEGAGPRSARRSCRSESAGEETKRAALERSDTRVDLRADRNPAGQPRSQGGFSVLAIAASSPTDAWLLAQLDGHPTRLRCSVAKKRGHGAVWQPVSPGHGEPAGAPLQVPLGRRQARAVTPRVWASRRRADALLTASGEQGLWIDGERSDTLTPMTMFFKPEGCQRRSVLASWCAGRHGELARTRHELAQWPRGTRIAADGALAQLRLGELLRAVWRTRDHRAERRRHAAPGRRRIQARARAGLLRDRRRGRQPRRRVLRARRRAGSGAPGCPSISRNSPKQTCCELSRAVPPPAAGGRATARRDRRRPVQRGARRRRRRRGCALRGPEVGWQPESLLNIAGVRQTPQLRAVAWPTPSRAYAVGTAGQMWLWRGETGLWEKDPATPINFRGDLLGIAFDPEEPSRGYAVGQGGVLLRYGKTWTQEPTCAPSAPEPCLPAEVADASFTSIAFAGSEALVAYRVPHFTFNGQSERTQLHRRAARQQRLGLARRRMPPPRLSRAKPRTFPGRSRGCPTAARRCRPRAPPACRACSSATAPGDPWEATAQPYPGYSAPGALSLFREGGALRVIGTGAVPDTDRADEQTPPPAGFPPALIRPYPLAQAPAFMFRQTASGWSEEEHDHDEVGPPVGNYKQLRQGLRAGPDLGAADRPRRAPPAGRSVVSPRANRRPGSKPPTSRATAIRRRKAPRRPAIGEVPSRANPARSLFAVGGGAQCGAPCAARAQARHRPGRLAVLGARTGPREFGVRDFLYTGPRVTTGATAVQATLPNPLRATSSRATTNCSARAKGLRAYAAASPTDPSTKRRVPVRGKLLAVRFYERRGGPCASGTVRLLRVRTRAGPSGTVQVIVLDDSSVFSGDSCSWLEQGSRKRTRPKKPAIVIGNANLNAQEERGEGEAGEVVQDLVPAKPRRTSSTRPNRTSDCTCTRLDIPAYGSGTLGYVSVQSAEFPEFIGASGFLLAQVGEYEATEARHPCPRSPSS